MVVWNLGKSKTLKIDASNGPAQERECAKVCKNNRAGWRKSIPRDNMVPMARGVLPFYKLQQSSACAMLEPPP
jgi:hypothetical protein